MIPKLGIHPCWGFEKVVYCSQALSCIYQALLMTLQKEDNPLSVQSVLGDFSQNMAK